MNAYCNKKCSPLEGAIALCLASYYSFIICIQKIWFLLNWNNIVCCQTVQKQVTCPESQIKICMWQLVLWALRDCFLIFRREEECWGCRRCRSQGLGLPEIDVRSGMEQPTRTTGQKNFADQFLPCWKKQLKLCFKTAGSWIHFPLPTHILPWKVQIN